MRKQYVRYRLIRESDTAKQPTGGTEVITGHTSLAVSKEVRQGSLTYEQTIDLLKKAGKVLSSSAVTAAKIARYVLKTLGASFIGKWIKSCADSATTLVVGTLRGARKDSIDWISNLVKNLWKIAGKELSNMWTGFASMCCALLPFFKNAITGMLKGKNESAYASSLRLSNRAIKILSESANNNPGVIRRILANVIEKAKAACRDLYNLCVKNNIVKKNPKLAGKVGLSTILICGYPSTPTQTVNLPNGTAVGAN